MEQSPSNKLTLWTIDAFTDQPFSGNPAAVTIVTDFPSEALCQKIAAEMNLSETAFLKPLGRDHFHIRWFTPKVKVKLCGHATLASAHILFENGYVQGGLVTLDSLSGPLYVKKLESELVLDFPLQKTGATFTSPTLAQVFGTTQILKAVQAYDDVIIELPDEQA
jgi:PhzF family phenazine biosynthesis protein